MCVCVCVCVCALPPIPSALSHSLPPPQPSASAAHTSVSRRAGRWRGGRGESSRTTCESRPHSSEHSPTYSTAGERDCQLVPNPLNCVLSITVEPLLKGHPRNMDTSVLRTLCYVPNMLSLHKFIPEMRKPLYRGHFTRYPRFP